MNLQQLEYFKTIYETKNFTIAANKLSVTQPALSKAISKLEDELDVPLFEREGRNMKVTQYGEAFLKFAESALNEIERGKETLEYMKNRSEMTISLGSTQCIGVTFMPFIISGFLNKNLNAKFNFNTETTEGILKELQSGKIDLGFFSDIEKVKDYPEIEVKLIKEEECVLIVPKNHHLSNREEVSLIELKEENFIIYNEKSHDKKLSYSEFMGYTPKILVEPNEASILAGLVEAGAGIAIVMNTPFINTNKISIIKIKDKLNHKSIYMGWNKEKKLTKNARQFKDYVLEFYNTQE